MKPAGAVVRESRNELGFAWFPSACFVRAYAVRAGSADPVLNLCQISRPRTAGAPNRASPAAGDKPFELSPVASHPKPAGQRASGRPSAGPEPRGILFESTIYFGDVSSAAAIERLGDRLPHHRLRHAMSHDPACRNRPARFWFAALCTFRRSRSRSPGLPCAMRARCLVFSGQIRRRFVGLGARRDFALRLSPLRNSWPETDTTLRQLRVPIDI